MNTVSGYLLVLTLAFSSATFATEDDLSPLRVCNTNLDKVNLVEGIADPFRLAVSLIGTLKNNDLFEACWLRVENRLSKTGELDYYLGFLLPFIAIIGVALIRQNARIKKSQ